MRFRSTMTSAGETSFKDAVLACLPPDDGLYVPAETPDMRQFFLHMDESTTYPELVAALAPSLLQGELNPLQAARAAESAFDFEPSLQRLDDRFSVLSLCQGPTGVFKDFGVAFLGALLEELVRNDRRSAMIISAARGSTGVSLARAFQGRGGLTAVLLYPEGVIRGLDPGSYAPAGNIIPIQVRGGFDDCQRLVKDLIHDRPFSDRHHVTSANAINPGRLLPQAFYYLYAFIRLKKNLDGQDLVFSVPCGNFGNLISGLYAWKFGLPVNGFIAAMNANNAAGDFIRGGGAFTPRPLKTTQSPALDVARPSNLERLASFYQEAPLVMRNMVFPAAVSDAETVDAMRRASDRYGLLLDPHGAVAFAAALAFAARPGAGDNAHVVILATGHPAREPEPVEAVTGRRVEIPGKLGDLRRPAFPLAVIDPQLDALEAAIASCCG